MMKSWFSKKKVKDKNQHLESPYIYPNNKGLKDVLDYIEHDQSIKEKQLNQILNYAEDLIKLSASEECEEAETQPIFSYIKIFTDYIQTKNVIHILSNSEFIPIGSGSISLRDSYHHTINDIFMDLLGEGEHHLRKFKKRYTVQNGKHPIVTEIWNPDRITNNIATIGKGIKFSKRDNNTFEHYDFNHRGTYIYPLGIVHVDNGNHSINAGMLKSEGHFYIDDIIDISRKYNQYYFDGTNIVDVNNNNKRFIFFELGVIYEIGRLLLRDNTPFSDEIKNTIKEKEY